MAPMLCWGDEEEGPPNGGQSDLIRKNLIKASAETSSLDQQIKEFL